jgi:hypothetical protein
MEIKVTFRLFEDATLTAAAVTRTLGIQATRTREAGDPVSSRSGLTRDCSAWLLSSSPQIQTGAGLAEHLHRLLAILEPVTVPLWELRSPARAARQRARLDRCHRAWQALDLGSWPAQARHGPAENTGRPWRWTWRTC